MDKVYSLMIEAEMLTFVGVTVLIILFNFAFVIVSMITILVSALYEHLISENQVTLFFLVICLVLAMFFYS